MQFDTDVLIHLERGVRAAGLAFDAAAERRISAQTWMEILAGAKDREHLARIRSMPRHLGLEIVPIDQAISHRAALLIEEHGLSHGMQPGDALVAATALAFGETLCTGNVKHFKPIRGLHLKAFKP
jgi:predicted nucleic acid-binding protein